MQANAIEHSALGYGRKGKTQRIDRGPATSGWACVKFEDTEEPLTWPWTYTRTCQRWLGPFGNWYTGLHGCRSARCPEIWVKSRNERNPRD